MSEAQPADFDLRPGDVLLIAARQPRDEEGAVAAHVCGQIDRETARRWIKEARREGERDAGGGKRE